MADLIGLNSKEDLDKVVSEPVMSLIYFSSESCGVCKSLRPKIESLLDAYPNIKGSYVDVEKNTKLGISHSIFTIPSILVFIEGKETLRESRHLSVVELESKIDRYYKMLFE